jgi:hypothetical protein
MAVGQMKYFCQINSDFGTFSFALASFNEILAYLIQSDKLS